MKAVINIFWFIQQQLLGLLRTTCRSPTIQSPHDMWLEAMLWSLDSYLPQ